MTLDVLEKTAEQQTRLTIVDCDIHPTVAAPADYMSFLSKRWQTHAMTIGAFIRQGLAKNASFPRIAPASARGDSFPPQGGKPGSDLAFMRTQHLDTNGVEYGILQPLEPSGHAQRNIGFGAALCSAVNDWQVETWTSKEKRLKGSIVVTHEDTEAALAEIERWSGHPGFVQIAMPPRSDVPMGRKCFWPIYAAAVEHNLPIGVHRARVGGHPPTGAGWPSFYVEEQHSNALGMQSFITSLVLEGVFERFPTLKIVMIESGLAWIPALSWRLDKHWARLRDEVPHLTRPPSEYIRQNMWFTTQPIEEPERAEDILHLFDWIGWDRILFSTDYPHWDFDDPKYAFKVKMTQAQKDGIYRGNAKALYGLT